MQEKHEIELPSGAKLQISLAPFAHAKQLYQAVLEELKLLRISSDMEVDLELIKNLFCAGLSSKKVEDAVDLCMKRVTYNNIRITPDTFEPAEARQDYIPALLEVVQVNLLPFMKSLMPRLQAISQKISNSPKPS